jgi:Dynamin central region
VQRCKALVAWVAAERGQLFPRAAPERRPQLLYRFPRLLDEVSDVVQSFLDEAARRAESMLTALFECELAYINVDHPSFIGMRAAWQELMERRSDGSDAENGTAHGNLHVRSARSAGGLSHQHGRAPHMQPRHHAVCTLQRCAVWLPQIGCGMLMRRMLIRCAASRPSAVSD